MISPKSGMHPTANQRGCHRELAAHHVALASGDGGVSPEIELISPSTQLTRQST
jgi:hypothetical protein